MRILLVDDNAELCEALQISLEKAEFKVTIAQNGTDALYYLLQNAFDACILDRMLPMLSGIEVLAKARAAGISTPVLMLTALSSISDRVDGLDAGADDYLTKPFSTAELLARVRALLRRPAPAQKSSEIKSGDMTLFINSDILQGPLTSCTLSGRESALLCLLFKNEGLPINRSTILNRVWGPDFEVEDGNLDNYIHLVRRRLDTVGSKCKINTLRGIGYRYVIC